MYIYTLYTTKYARNKPKKFSKMRIIRIFIGRDRETESVCGGASIYRRVYNLNACDYMSVRNWDRCLYGVGWNQKRENNSISPAATAGAAVTMLMADNRLSVRWTHIDTYCTALIVFTIRLFDFGFSFCFRNSYVVDT